MSHADPATPNPSEGKKPLVIETVSSRERIIAILIGLACLLVVLFAVSKLGNRLASNTLTGTIIAKSFTPLKEEQITLGRQGVKARAKDGDYEFRVNVQGREYIVPVYKETYKSKKEGDTFTFARPPSTP